MLAVTNEYSAQSIMGALCRANPDNGCVWANRLFPIAVCWGGGAGGGMCKLSLTEKKRLNAMFKSQECHHEVSTLTPEGKLLLP